MRDREARLRNNRSSKKRKNKCRRIFALNVPVICAHGVRDAMESSPQGE